MRKDILARRALTIAILAALFSTFLVIPVVPVTAQSKSTVVFDYSHGQSADKLLNTTDLWLKNNLTQMGYTVVWAKGGLNSSVLSDAVALFIGSLYGVTNNFTEDEVTAVKNWFESGNKFLWIGCDSDYKGAAYINNNMTVLLEAVGSHVYPEPTSVSDAYVNAQASYRVVANNTDVDASVSSIVEGVTNVLMHGPTLLYGSNSDTPAANKSPVALETTHIANVEPILYYNSSATIADADMIAPVAHNDGDSGAFVAATIETKMGPTHSSVLVVSGASPYGDYMPMYADEYYGVPLQGNRFVLQAFTFGVNVATGGDMTMILLIGGIGVVVIVIIVAVVMMKKKSAA